MSLQSEQILTAVKNVASEVKDMRVEVSDVKKNVALLNQSIKGNGFKGLAERMTDVEDEIENNRPTVSRWRTIGNIAVKILGAVCTATILGMLAFIVKNWWPIMQTIHGIGG
jgi:hypothetical protein